MREIKFRGMDIVNNKWLYGNLEIPLINQSKSKYFIIGYSYGQYQKHEVDPKTVGQYTGLKDKNGKEIYEGDILYIPSWKRKYKVVFEAGMFRGKSICRWTESKVSLATFQGEVGCKVIGNIYENPELIRT